MFPSIPDLARVFPQQQKIAITNEANKKIAIIQDFNRRNILAQAHCAFILVLTGKKPNSAAISDDISDVDFKTNNPLQA